MTAQVRWSCSARRRTRGNQATGFFAATFTFFLHVRARYPSALSPPRHDDGAVYGARGALRAALSSDCAR